MLAATSLSLDAYGRRSRSHHPESGTHERSQIVKLNQPSEAYRYWRSRGYHGKIIVEMTGRWQTVTIEGDRLDGARYPLELKNLSREKEKLLSDENYLFMAAITGIARRIVTILPQDGYLKRRELSQGNKTFIERDGTFTVYYSGFAREFATMGSFRSPKEPVLLYIEGSFAGAHEIEDLIRQLEVAGLQAESVVYSPSPLGAQVGTGASL